jgi:hypothetical protein
VEAEQDKQTARSRRTAIGEQQCGSNNAVANKPAREGGSPDDHGFEMSVGNRQLRGLLAGLLGACPDQISASQPSCDCNGRGPQ